MSTGGDPKYGRIFTEADVERILAYGRFEGAPDRVAEIVRDMEASGKRITFSADELVFVLRAQDDVARLAIADYQRRAIKAGAGRPHIEAVGRVLREFGIFAGEHPERLKLPDTDPPAGGCPECGKPEGAGHAPTCSIADGTHG